MFQQSALKVNHNSRNCGIDSIWQKLHNVCRCILAAAGTELSSVSCGQVKSKDMLCSDD